jgi:hypothetical protein
MLWKVKEKYLRKSIKTVKMYLWISLIPKRNDLYSASKIFRPGWTTKSRGWGLGLSLSKRIIEEYHGGKIFVKKTTPEKEQLSPSD